ncbi:MAG: DUF2344 domain-containing protein [Erysipelotrichia bacterium]|nr:DUF2344 domain-containing protein [Erysipelotrichia bacterium]
MSTAEEFKVRVDYTKTCQSRYIAHLDTIDVISKALRRLQLPYSVTQGCHARPKLTFGPPLPLGHASFCEYFILTMASPVDAEWLKTALTRELPHGMHVSKIEMPYTEKKTGTNGEKLTYRLVFSDNETAQKAVDFLQNPSVTFEVERKGQLKKYQLGDAVRQTKLSQYEDKYLVEAQFVQGLPDVPSVSKIVTALAEHLGESKNGLMLIERVALSEV